MQMSQREWTRQRRRVQKQLEHWKVLLGLGPWRVDCLWSDGPFGEGTGSPRTMVVADITVSWEYMRATLRVDLQAVAELDDADLEAAVIHELLHAVVNELRHWSADDGVHHEERVVSHLTTVIGWVRDHYHAQGRKGR